MRDVEREPPSEGRLETTKGCGEMADWDDDKQGDEGDQWRRTLTDPTLLRVLGDIAGERVLDMASHPCFDAGNASALVIEKIGLTTKVWRKVGAYREPFEDLIEWRIEPAEVLRTPSYRRPISWYFRNLRSAGFVVTALEDPEPTEEFSQGTPQGPWMAQTSLHCVVEAPQLARPVR